VSKLDKRQSASPAGPQRMLKTNRKLCIITVLLTGCPLTFFCIKIFFFLLVLFQQRYWKCLESLCYLPSSSLKTSELKTQGIQDTWSFLTALIWKQELTGSTLKWTCRMWWRRTPQTECCFGHICRWDDTSLIFLFVL
jgi:hypothetical protein